jgi:ubiquinone/menaquinone biosynthesis C-methylase UbiE
MAIPEYTAHEIHSMPGGYVGDAFAGHMYDCGTNWGAYVDRNYQDGAHLLMAANAAVPADGKVRRILDIGTSIGQFASSMKRRFPEAEVWGVDIGGPMVRYAHMKAADNGIAVNFAQRLAEDTKFPDNYFDIVVSNLLFHEVSYTGAQAIIKEVARVLRPGGVFSPTDDNTPPPTVKAKYTLWYNYRWNHEDWYADWHSVDFAGEMKKNGIKVTAKKGDRYSSAYVGVKT